MEKPCIAQGRECSNLAANHCPLSVFESRNIRRKVEETKDMNLSWITRFLPQKRPKVNRVDREELGAYALGMAAYVQELLCLSEPTLKRMLHAGAHVEPAVSEPDAEPIDCIMIALKLPFRDDQVLAAASFYMDNYQLENALPGTYLKQLTFTETRE